MPRYGEEAIRSDTISVTKVVPRVMTRPLLDGSFFIPNRRKEVEG